MLRRVNETYFGGSINDVLITWGRRPRKVETGAAPIKLGSYSAEERLIRIHPVLDEVGASVFRVVHRVS